jgi:voltage-gated potassium channel Kch
MFCIAYYLFDYVVRVVSADAPSTYVLKMLNIFDAASCIPFFIELIVDAAAHERTRSLGQLRILRIFRLLRGFRGLRATSSTNNLAVLQAAVVESIDMLGVLMFMLCIAIVAFSTFIYYAEHGSQEESEPWSTSTSQRVKSFLSIPDAFWWSIVTLMTVGYGDQVPVTPAGKAVAGVAMVVSFVILALPISVIGANFTQQWLMMKKSAEQTASLEAEFRKLHDDLAVHNRVLLEIIDAVSTREAHMEEKGRRLQALARSIGVNLEGIRRTNSMTSAPAEDADAPSPPPPPPPPAAPPPPLPPLCDRRATPRAVLIARETEVEVLLADLAGDGAWSRVFDCVADLTRSASAVREVEETFALAELVTSEDFVSTCDAVLAKHSRLQAMESAGNDACHAVSQLMALLSEERAARPTMLATAARTRVPGLAEAAAEAAAILGLGRLAGVGLGGGRKSHIDPSAGGLMRTGRTGSSGTLLSGAASPATISSRTVLATLATLDGIMSMRFGMSEPSSHRGSVRKDAGAPAQPRAPDGPPVQASRSRRWFSSSLPPK